MRVGLVFGGNTTEGEVSKHSAEGIRGALKSLGYDVIDIEFDKNVALKILDSNVDVIFNAMHGQYGEDGCLQGLLDIMQIPYTHSGKLASAIAMNKQVCNQLFASAGIKTIPGIVVSKEELYNDVWKEKVKNSPIANAKEFFVKPVCDGSSRDTFLVKNIDEFNFKTKQLQTSSEDFLIEQRIYGREIQCTVLGDKAIGLLEVCPNNEFYDYEAKYTENGAVHKQVEMNDIAQEIMKTAEKMHKLIGLKDISRSEFLLTKEGEFYVLEINSHPGFTPTSIVPEIALNAGITYNEIVDMLVKNAKFE